MDELLGVFDGMTHRISDMKDKTPMEKAYDVGLEAYMNGETLGERKADLARCYGETSWRCMDSGQRLEAKHMFYKGIEDYDARV